MSNLVIPFANLFFNRGKNFITYKFSQIRYSCISFIVLFYITDKFFNIGDKTRDFFNIERLSFYRGCCGVFACVLFTGSIAFILVDILCKFIDHVQTKNEYINIDERKPLHIAIEAECIFVSLVELLFIFCSISAFLGDCNLLDVMSSLSINPYIGMFEMIFVLVFSTCPSMYRSLETVAISNTQRLID